MHLRYTLGGMRSTYRPLLAGILVAILSVCIPLSVSGLELDRDELENATGADIDFENYEGPVDRIDSREAIREIGRSMGRAVRAAGSGDYDARYRARRVLGNPGEPGLAADVIELDDGARVDHIRNLRRILAGYLEAAWDYEAEDADLLARFITLYNAVNRGAFTVIEERYRPAVVDTLDAPRIGLSTSYREWAGQTQLVIPIRDDRRAGALDAVDPGQLVDARVIDELRSRADLGIEDRKAIIDFIERVIEERTEAIVEEREQLEQEQAEIDERQAEIEEETEAIAQQEPDADEPAAQEPASEDEPEPVPAEADGDPAEQEPAEGAAETAAEPADEPAEDEPDEPDEPAAAEQTDAASEQADDEPDADLEAEQEELEEREQEIAERQEELDEEAEEVAELTERVEELYEETAEDQAQAEEGGAAVFVPFILSEGGSGFALAAVNFDDAELAGVQTIPLASRSAAEYGGGLVVAHRGTGQLLMVEPSSMEIMAEGDAPVEPGAQMVVVDDRLLTVVPVEGEFYVGEFDPELTLQRRSAQPVLAETDIVSRNEQVLVQGTNGNLRVLLLE